MPGLLHGIYAFMCVTEYWLRQRRADQDSRGADFKFLYHREQVRAALSAVAAMPELTEFGTRLVDAVRARLAACDAEAVPDEFAEPVLQLLAVHRFSWRLRHLAPSAADVAESVRCWLAGDAPPASCDSVLAPDHRAGHDSALPALLRARALDPGRVPAAADPGESALADGRRDEAVHAFAERIATDPDDDGAWVGLFAVTRASADVPIETALATYERLRAVDPVTVPDPVTVADWFTNRIGPG